MIGILFFLLSGLVGWSLVRFILPKGYVWERILIAAIIGIVTSGWLTYLLSLVLAYKFAVPVSAFLQIAFVVFTGDWYKGKVRIPKIRFTPSLILFLFVAAGASYQYYLHSLEVVGTDWYEPGYSWGDVAIHMSLISSVAYKGAMSMVMPVFAHSPLTYPFLIDYYSGILLRLGASWQLALFLPGFTLFTALSGLSILATRRLTKNVLGGWLHYFLYIFCGSVAGFFIFLQNIPEKGWYTAIQVFDYSNNDKFGLHFANVVTSQYLPQRSFMFGSAAFLVVVWLLTEYFEKRNQRALWFAGALIGLMPFMHVHSFLVTVGLWGCLTGYYLIVERKTGLDFLKVGILLVLLSVPQLYWQFTGSYSEHFGRTLLWWLKPSGQTPLVFWLRNVGLVVPLIFVFPWILKKMRNPLVSVMVVYALCISIATNLRSFQPNEWDNTKLMIYAYWIWMIPLAWFLAACWKGWWRVITVLGMVTMCGAGLMAVVREAMPETSYALFSSNEIAFARDVRAIIPEDDVVLTSDRHNNPVVTLAGRTVYLGYPGWIWSYGIDYRPREAERKKIFSGYQKQLPEGIRYIVLSDTEMLQDRINVNILRTNFSEIYYRYGWHIFLQGAVSTGKAGTGLLTSGGVK